MPELFAQFGSDGVVFNVSDKKPGIENVIECGGYDVLGKKWDGEKFVSVPAPVRYKIWSKPDFILTLGQSVYDSIVDSEDKGLRFAKYVLDSADSVDMNNPQYVALVDMLKVKNLIDAAKLAALKVQV